MIKEYTELITNFQDVDWKSVSVEDASLAINACGEVKAATAVASISTSALGIKTLEFFLMAPFLMLALTGVIQPITALWIALCISIAAGLLLKVVNTFFVERLNEVSAEFADQLCELSETHPKESEVGRV